MESLTIKTKVWIENERNDMHFGKGKTEILERIEQDGPIVNYKKVLKNMQTSGFKKSF